MTKTLRKEQYVVFVIINIKRFTIYSQVESLRCLGGTNYRDCARRFMKRILTDQLAKLYSLHGHKGKQVFATLKLFSLVTGN